MGEVANKLLWLEDSVSPPLQACILAVKKMTKSAEEGENMLQKILGELNFLCTGACVGAVRRRRPIPGSAQEKQNMPRGNFCFFLCDRGEDMTKWDGKPTVDLEA